MTVGGMGFIPERLLTTMMIIINNNIRLVTLAEQTSDHGKQTNASTKERGSRARKLLGSNAKSSRLKLKLKLSRLVSKAPTRLAPAGNPPPQLPVQHQLMMMMIYII